MGAPMECLLRPIMRMWEQGKSSRSEAVKFSFLNFFPIFHVFGDFLLL
jgi:hypothetical protein